MLSRRPRPLDFAFAPDRPDVAFRWNHPHDPYLREIRAAFGAIAGSSDDLRPGGVHTLRSVVDALRHAGRHDGRAAPATSDPLDLLRRWRTGEAFRCVEFSIAAAACFAAAGLAARVVELMRDDVERRRSTAAHVVCEVFLEERQGWVLVDPQHGAIPLLAGHPVSAVALQRAIAARSAPLSLDDAGGVDAAAYFAWLSPYLFYFRVPIDNRFGAADRSPAKLMLLPLGAAEPRVLQRCWPVRDTRCTRSLATFYQPPDSCWSAHTMTAGNGSRIS